jgi:hypothetical protein
MAEAAEVAKTARRARGADLRSAPVLWLFLALVTCHSTLLFGQRFSHVQGAMVQVTSAWTSSPFTLSRQASYWRGDCISLTWTPPAGAQGNSAYSYDVYRGKSPGNETGPINASPVDAGCTSQANCTYVDYGPQAGAEYYYTVTAVSAGVESPFSNESGAVIPQDAVMETNAANDVVSRGWGAIRGATENLLAYDSLTAGSFIPVQPKHAFVVPGRTKAGQAPVHKPSAAPP